MAEKIIRDPVHDVIAFRTDRADEALLFRLINAAEFQRLRRIRQLGLASLAYPGAEHSRYAHCLGVMQTARRILARLRDLSPLDERQGTICVVAALLHDLGHGPFSHVFERVTGVHHESVTRRVILDEQSEVQQILASYEPEFPQRIVDFLDERPSRTFYNDILSSQLDADRFDYLLRDNLMTGSQYGGFDLAWLVQMLAVDESSNRLVVIWKGESALLDYLQSRYHMYRNVYFHKVVRSAEGMIRLALQRARRLAIQDRLPWPPRDHYVHKALLGQTLSIGEFADLDDVSMLNCFKLWTDAEDQPLAQLCRGLLFRKLFKVIDVSDREPEQVRAIYGEAKRCIDREGGDSDYDIFLDEPSAEDANFDQSSGLFVRDSSGKVSDFAHRSPLVSAMNKQLVFRRIHVKESLRPLVIRCLKQ